jgi:hypothetical protein
VPGFFLAHRNAFLGFSFLRFSGVCPKLRDNSVEDWEEKPGSWMALAKDFWMWLSVELHGPVLNLYTLDSSEVALDFTGCRKKGGNGKLSPAWDTACYYLSGRKHHQYRADNRRSTCIFQKGVIHMAKLLC